MMRRAVLLVATVVLLGTLTPAAARAAEVTEYQLQLSPVTESGASQMIVTVILNPTTSLPATVSVPAPVGSTLLWSGELLGGAPGADPHRDAVTRQVDGAIVHTFTLEKSFVGQVELLLGAPSAAGTKVTSSVTWPNPGPETLVSGSVVVEPNATGVHISPSPTGEVRSNDRGERLFSLGGRRIPTGATYTIDASWRRGGNSLPVLPLAGGGLLVAVVALILVVAREKARARRVKACATCAADRQWA